MAATAAHADSMREPPAGAAPLLDTRALAGFVNALPIPHAAQPAGTRPSLANPASLIPYYRVVMKDFQAKVHRDVPATTFGGYNSSCPGPTIAARSGEPILVEWANDLPHQHLFRIDQPMHGAEADKPEVRTVVHLNGGRTGE
jgi:spore coat protein A